MIYSENPETYRGSYDKGLFGISELFAGLVYCVRFHPVEAILRFLKPDELPEFLEYVRSFDEVKSDSEVLRINYPAPWSMQEMTQVATYLEKMENFNPAELRTGRVAETEEPSGLRDQ